MKLLLIIPVLTLAMAALLACGTAAVPVEDEPAGIVTPPTDFPEDAPQAPSPTQGIPQDAPQDQPHTELGVVFDAPANTPRPTLIPDPPGAAEEFARNQATFEAQAVAGQASVPPSTTEVTQQARDFSQGYPGGAIVRAEVIAHHVVEPNLDITWPEGLFGIPYYTKLENEDEYAGYRRSKLKINESYYNTLPQGYEMVAPDFAINQALEIGKEYILYVVRTHLAEDELPSVERMHRYNEEQLAALGGPGGLAWLDTNWIIDDGTAWKITEDYMLTPQTFTPTLAAAKANGASLPLADLEAAIRAGVGN